jgi:hypothetical protein
LAITTLILAASCARSVGEEAQGRDARRGVDTDVVVVLVTNAQGIYMKGWMADCCAVVKAFSTLVRL